jgi:hypothetical protein
VTNGKTWDIGGQAVPNVGRAVQINPGEVLWSDGPLRPGETIVGDQPELKGGVPIEKEVQRKGQKEDVKPAGAAAPPSSLLPSKQTKPLEAQRDQIRRILTEIDRRRTEDDGPLPSRAAEDALTARLKVIEEELYVRATWR